MVVCFDMTVFTFMQYAKAKMLTLMSGGESKKKANSQKKMHDPNLITNATHVTCN